jgi:RNA polymerase-interacting CarD/CdnL/TRCF family regulator
VSTLLTVRLDRKTKALVHRIARERRLTASEVVRQALEALKPGDATSAYELVKDLVGCVHGGERRSSEQTGRRFAALLKSRPLRHK